MSQEPYKYCAVNMCKSTSLRTPRKIFIRVPNKDSLRNVWLGRASSSSKGPVMYFCEDHFDLKNDMENYMEFYMMGSGATVRMKPNILPSRFDCQRGRRKQLLEVVDEDWLENDSNTTVEHEHPLTNSTNLSVECADSIPQQSTTDCEETHEITVKIEPVDDDDVDVEVVELSPKLNHVPPPRMDNLIRHQYKPAVHHRNMYKACFVPGCGYNSRKYPGKVFVNVPHSERLRREWFKAVNVPFDEKRKDKVHYCCEDHFKTLSAGQYACWDRYQGMRPGMSDSPPASDKVVTLSSINVVRVGKESESGVDATAGKKTLGGSVDSPGESSQNSATGNKDVNPAPQPCISIKSEMLSDLEASEEDVPEKRRKKGYCSVKSEIQLEDVKHEEESNDEDEIPVLKRFQVAKPIQKKFAKKPSPDASCQPRRMPYNPSITTVTLPSRFSGSGFVNVFPEPFGFMPTDSCFQDPRESMSSCPILTSSARKRVMRKAVEKKSSVNTSVGPSNAADNEDSRSSFMQYLKTLLRCCNDKERSEFQSMAIRWFLDNGIVGREDPKK